MDNLPINKNRCMICKQDPTSGMVCVECHDLMKNDRDHLLELVIRSRKLLLEWQTVMQKLKIELYEGESNANR